MTEKVFHMQPWTPKIQEAARNLIDKIHTAAPELEVLFMGAAALGLPGKNDIDLDILCHQDDIKDYTQKLLSILGTLKKLTIISRCGTSIPRVDIDAILSDPSHMCQNNGEYLKN